MKYHTRRHWLENIKHLQSYLGTSISHMQNCHVSSWHWSKQILDVLKLGKHLTVICITPRYFKAFFRRFIHLLKDSIIVSPS